MHKTTHKQKNPSMRTIDHIKNIFRFLRCFGEDDEIVGSPKAYFKYSIISVFLASVLTAFYCSQIYQINMVLQNAAANQNGFLISFFTGLFAILACYIFISVFIAAFFEKSDYYLIFTLSGFSMLPIAVGTTILNIYFGLSNQPRHPAGDFIAMTVFALTILWTIVCQIRSLQKIGVKSVERWEVILLVIIFVFGLIIRLRHADAHFLDSDDITEYQSALNFLRYKKDYVSSFGGQWARGGHFILNPSLIYLSFNLFGVSVFSARLVSIVISLLTIGIIYLIGRLYNSKVGLISAFLFATSFYSVLFSNLISSYGIMLLVYALTLYFIYRGTVKGNLKNLCFAGVIGSLGLYAQLYALFLVPMIFVFVLLSLRFWRKFSKIQILTFTACSGILAFPALIKMRQHFSTVLWFLLDAFNLQGYVADPTVRMVASDAIWGVNIGVFDSGNKLVLWLISKDLFTIPILFFFVVGLGYSIYKRNLVDKLILSWFFSILLIYLTIFNFIYARSLFFLVPPIIILSARAILLISDSGHRFIRSLRSPVYKEQVSTQNRPRIKSALIILLIIPFLLFQGNLTAYMLDKYLMAPTIAFYVDSNVVQDALIDNIPEGSNVFVDHSFLSRGYESDPFIKYTASQSIDYRHLNYYVQDQYFDALVFLGSQVGRISSMGGPVMMSGEYGQGNIVISTLEPDREGKLGYIQNVLTAYSPKKTAVVYYDSEHNWLVNSFDTLNFACDEYDASNNGIAALMKRISDYQMVVIGSYVANGNIIPNYISELQRFSDTITNFIQRGGNFVAFGLQGKHSDTNSQIVDWLPLRTMVSTSEQPSFAFFASGYPLTSSFREEAVILRKNESIVLNSDILGLNASLQRGYGVFTDYDQPYAVIAREVTNGMPTLLSASYGSGKICVTTLMPDYHYDLDFLRDVMFWTESNEKSQDKEFVLLYSLPESNVAFQELTNEQFDAFNTTDIEQMMGNLSSYKVFVIGSRVLSNLPEINMYKTEIMDYIEQGGTLIVFDANGSMEFLPYSVTVNETLFDAIYIDSSVSKLGLSLSESLFLVDDITHDNYFYSYDSRYTIIAESIIHGYINQYYSLTKTIEYEGIPIVWIYISRKT